MENEILSNIVVWVSFSFQQIWKNRIKKCELFKMNSSVGSIMPKEKKNICQLNNIWLFVFKHNCVYFACLSKIGCVFLDSLAFQKSRLVTKSGCVNKKWAYCWQISNSKERIQKERIYPLQQWIHWLLRIYYSKAILNTSCDAQLTLSFVPKLTSTHCTLGNYTVY